MRSIKLSICFFLLMEQIPINYVFLFIIFSTTLGSDIVSTSIQCGSGICDNIQTEPQNPIIITFEHSKYTKVSLSNQNINTKFFFDKQ